MVIVARRLSWSLYCCEESGQFVGKTFKYTLHVELTKSNVPATVVTWCNIGATFLYLSRLNHSLKRLASLNDATAILTASSPISNPTKNCCRKAVSCKKNQKMWLDSFCFNQMISQYIH